LIELPQRLGRVADCGLSYGAVLHRDKPAWRPEVMLASSS